MKKILAIAVILITIIGCEKRVDPFEADNTYPIMDIKSVSVNPLEVKVGQGKDSIINILDTIKNGCNTISVTINVKNEGQHLKSFLIQYNDTISKTYLDLYNHAGFFYVNNYGNYSNYTLDTVKIQATDYYNKTTTANLIICYIENLKPYAKFEIAKIGNVSPYEIRIDASDSYDSDSRYGGQITAYYFDVAGYTVQNDDPILNHVLPGPGTYTVRVKVQDNNGLWSQEVQTTVQF